MARCAGHCVWPRLVDFVGSTVLTSHRSQASAGRARRRELRDGALQLGWLGSLRGALCLALVDFLGASVFRFWCLSCAGNMPRYCSGVPAMACCFSTGVPGERAQPSPGQAACVWCDDGRLLLAAEKNQSFLARSLKAQANKNAVSCSRYLFPGRSLPLWTRRCGTRPPTA